LVVCTYRRFPNLSGCLRDCASLAIQQDALSAAIEENVLETIVE
jgi:hypothetical protein